MRIRVVKIGGAAFELPGGRQAIARALSAARRDAGLVIVHGGGREIDRWSRRLGVSMRREAGLRVTTPETLDVVEMVLAGRVNKALVGSLLDAGLEAVGLSGIDGGLFQATLADGGRLGRVGRIERVRAALVRTLLAAGYAPVVAPISRALDGGTLNVNADEAATALAVALSADELFFLTDVARVQKSGAECMTLSTVDAARLVGTGQARDGMVVKLDSACAALERGVGSVRIGSVDMLLDEEAGTRVLASAGRASVELAEVPA